MLIEIDPHAGVPIYRQIMDQVRRQIMTEQLAQGDRLEQVRALAARLKVNPMTVSKAYSFLEREGLVTRRRGVGMFVASVREDKRRRVKTQMLRDAMSQAAALAVQMGFSAEEAAEEFEKRFEQYHSTNGRKRK